TGEFVIWIILHRVNHVWVIQTVLNNDRVLGICVGDFFRSLSNYFGCGAVIFHQCVKFAQFYIADMRSLAMATLYFTEKNPASSHSVAVLDINPLFFRL